MKKLNLALDPYLTKKYNLSRKQETFLKLYLQNGMSNVLECYREAYNNDNPNRATVAPMASKILQNQKIQACLSDHLKKANLLGDKEIVSTQDVVQVLAGILNKEDAADKDRIKAGEILLKHLNAFKEHNNSKASKQLHITSEKSPEQLISDMKKLTDDFSTTTPISLTITNLSDIIEEEEIDLDTEDTNFEEI
jgi:hypothetical protein